MDFSDIAVALHFSIPAGEPFFVQVQSVSPDGSVKDGPRVIVPGAEGVAWGGAAVRDGC
jgi:hypothetical protein